MNYRVTIAILSAFFLVGCGGTRNWKEEVRLADSEVIVIDRYDRLGNPLDQEPINWEFGSPVVGFVLSIPIEGSWRPITWESGPGLIPLALGKKGENFYIAASPNTCTAYEKYGRPVPPYVFFKYDGKAWQRIPVMEFPEEINVANLLLSTRNYDQRQEIDSGLVTAEAVKRINRGASSYLRNIYRSGVKGMEMCIRKLPPKSNGKEK